MIPLAQPIITKEMKNEVLAVLDSGRFVSGPRVQQFEEAFAAYCHVREATAVSSGTAALYLALRALEIGPGDKVACPSFSFIATAAPILLVGATPVFIDVDDDYTMDIKDLERKLGPKTKAVIIVHLYGQMGGMEQLLALKKKHGFFLIEDACQAHGAEYDNQKAGSFGDIACFSFYASKNITVAGEGGMTVTSDSELNKRLKALGDHGVLHHEGQGKYISTLLGFNFKMSEISAAIGTIQLKHLDNWTEKRREIAREYSEWLPEVVLKPRECPRRKHAFHLYVVRVPRRDELSQLLRENGIETGIHYPIPIHRQPIFSSTLSLPKTDELCQQIISLPMYPDLTIDQVRYICQNISTHLE